MPIGGNSNRKGSSLEGPGVPEGNRKDTEVAASWVTQRS